MHYWAGSYYADAGELIGWEESDRRAETASDPIVNVSDRMAAILGPSGDADAAPGAGSARDPEQLRESTRKRSGRRARSKLRRYAAANRLDRLIVLTYAEPEFDLAKCKRDVRLFVKRKLRGLVGPDMAYAVTWEQHKSGAWHVNVLVNGYIRQPKLARAWGRGFVWIKKFKVARGGSGRDAARAAARYVAKYASKDVEGFADGLHRYEVGQGFQPNVVRLYAGSLAGLMEETGEETAPAYVWRSIGDEDFTGPPVGFVMWA